MTPQERQLIDELFDRLRTLENGPRDADAVRAINDGLERAPHALYPLVQTVLVQDEALKRADARIRALEEELGDAAPSSGGQGGFLDSMRDTLKGRREQPGSVPSVRLGGDADAKPSPWGPAAGRTGAMWPQGRQPMEQPSWSPGGAQPMPGESRGGSFLGTAAATAAGVVGGALLMNSFRGMFGGQQPGQQAGQAQSAFDQPSGGAPWGPGAGDSDLARQAGLDDIGRPGHAAYDDGGASNRTGLFDVAQHDTADQHADGEVNDDFGGDSDLA